MDVSLPILSTHTHLVFTERCTVVQSAIEVACRLSVRPSVRLSVCDVGGSGPHRLEIALRSPKAIHLLPGEHGEIWGRLEVGWGKVVC